MVDRWCKHHWKVPEQAFFSVAQCLWWSRVSTPIIEGELLRKTILLTFNNTTQINLVDELSNRTTNSCLANTYSLNFDKELYFYPAWPEKGRIRARWAKKSSSGGVGKELQFFATFPLVTSRVSCASPDWLKGNRHGGPSPNFLLLYTPYPRASPALSLLG